MTDTPEPRRLYDQKEVGAILRRASELQGADDPDRLPGLSLDELRQVATEAGIDPRYIGQAIDDLASGGDRSRSNFWGGPLSLTVERTIEGEIDEAVWEQMVSEIRKTFDQSGTVSAWGRALEWTFSASGGMQAHATAIRRDGKTHLQVRWSEPVLFVPFFVPTLVLSLVSPAVIFEAIGLGLAEGALVWLGFVATLLTLARTGLSLTSSKKRRKVRALITRLAAIAAESPEREPAQLDAEARGVIGLPDEDVYRDNRESVRPGTRRQTGQRP